MTSWADDVNINNLKPIKDNENDEPSVGPNSYIEYKKEILRFLFANADDQPILFRKLLTKRLNEYIDSMKSWKPEFIQINKKLAEDIHKSKENAINHLTVILKKQMEDYQKGIKPPPNVFSPSIIERKIFIVELQIEVGVYKLANKETVNFFFQT